MAGVLENGEFWLPSQFLADDEEVNKSPKSLLPSGFGFNSEPSSTTESDCDQEDYLDGLTRQMAHYTLQDDFVVKKDENNKEPNRWFNNSKGLLAGPPVRKPSGFFHPHQNLGATTQFQPRQPMKQHNAQVWGGNKPQHVVLQNNVSGCNNNNRPLGFAWPPLQQKQQNGSGIRAGFLANPNGKRECVGTGVFLPRHIGTRATATAQPRKKQGLSTPATTTARSTVFVPPKVVEALNLKIDEINAQLRRARVKASVATDSGGVPRTKTSRNGSANNPKQSKLRAEQGTSHEIRLPQEWTY